MPFGVANLDFCEFLLQLARIHKKNDIFFYQREYTCMNNAEQKPAEFPKENPNIAPTDIWPPLNSAFVF